MINELHEIISDEKTIYIRETISVMDTHLTLKNFYSENLETNYSAIYRTKDELMDFFTEFKNISNIKIDTIYETLKKYYETGHRYFIIE